MPFPHLTKKMRNLFCISCVYTMSTSDQMTQEVKMRLREKIGIFMLAVFLSFAAFSMIAAPAVDIIKIGKFAGYEIISNVLAQANSPLVHSIISKG